MARLYRLIISGLFLCMILIIFFSFHVVNEEMNDDPKKPGNLYEQFIMDEDLSLDEAHAQIGKLGEHREEEITDDEDSSEEDEDVHSSTEQYQGEQQRHEEELKKYPKQDEEIPIVLWWTPFTHEKWKLKVCGNEGQQCYLTENRTYFNHSNTKVIIIYGTDFPVGDMPIPRQPWHEWALLHEESPKNVYMYSHANIMELFNHTCTFKRESDYPVPMQFLKSVSRLESKDYLISTEEKNKRLSELAMVNYVHSDCHTPSDRDHFVEMLQRHIQVDSYGECLHNKDLPEDLKDPLVNMLKPKFLRFLAQYKFTLATENAICDDYMTEKLWRPFIVGSVPIIIGSPKTREFLPAEKSAIFVEDYKNITDLVNYLKFLNENDEEYNKYLEFKETGVQNKWMKKLLESRDWNSESTYKPGKYYHFVEGFECFVCRRVHENMKREKQNKKPLKFQADVSHFGCPKPKKFSDDPPGNLERVDDSFIAEEYIHSIYEADILRELIDKGKQITFEALYSTAWERRKATKKDEL